MRVVLDTNVFVSAVFFGGYPGRVLAAWRDGVIDVVVSTEIILECVRVGERLSERFPGVDIGPALDLIAAVAELVAAPPLPEAACRDPDDDKFLARALAAETRLVVSGDRDLLAVSPYRGVTVVRPRDLIEKLRQG